MKKLFDNFSSGCELILPHQGAYFIGLGDSRRLYNMIKNIGIYLIGKFPLFRIFSKGFILLVRNETNVSNVQQLRETAKTSKTELLQPNYLAQVCLWHHPVEQSHERKRRNSANPSSHADCLGTVSPMFGSGQSNRGNSNPSEVSRSFTPGEGVGISSDEPGRGGPSQGNQSGSPFN